MVPEAELETKEPRKKNMRFWKPILSLFNLSFASVNLKVIFYRDSFRLLITVGSQ